MPEGNGSTPQEAGDWRSSLRLTFAFILSAMVAITAIGIIAVSYTTARRNTLAVSSAILVQVSDQTEMEVHAFLEPPRNANLIVLRDVEVGVLDPNNVATMEGHLFNSMTVYESLAMLAWADEQGNFLMLKRKPDGSISTKDIRHDAEGIRTVTWTHRAPGDDFNAVTERVVNPDDSYDPRVRPWYTGAEEEGDFFWTDVYVFFTDKAPGVTASVPWIEHKEVRGVVAVDIGLADFSQFLSTLNISEHGEAYVLDHKGRLVATPRPDDLVVEKQTDGGTEFVLRTMATSTHPAIVALGGWPAFHEALASPTDTGQTFRFPVDGQTWIATNKPIHLGDDLWQIVVVAPEDDFLGDVKRQNRNNMITALVFGAFTIGLSLLLARWISGSLQLLVVESRKIRDLDFSEHVEASTPFKEIYDVLDAFDGMKIGLRSFQKYLPLKLVRILLENHQEPELGGEQMEVTIYFSDVVGFATVSENLEPMQMARRLGHYLATFSHKIQERQGTVVQYVGDEIMAFWNAPLPVPDHALQACHAALECNASIIDLWKDFPSTPLFPTRFGIHTTEVAVGHFGAPDRMYYGAVGDGVNLTSRLEGANKFYGTFIIISGSTHDRVKDHFETRLLDLVRVKGKNKPVAIHELIGVKGDVPQTRCEARDSYEEGLRSYRAQEWDEAVAAFDVVIAIRPDDKAAEEMKQRISVYRMNPPPANWDGGHTLTKK